MAAYTERGEQFLFNGKIAPARHDSFIHASKNEVVGVITLYNYQGEVKDINIIAPPGSEELE